MSNYDSAKLKGIMEKENLNWRSIADDGRIAAAWNQPGTPLYYVIDQQGIIRHKWFGYPGEKALDAALDQWIGKLEP